MSTLKFFLPAKRSRILRLIAGFTCYYIYGEVNGHYEQKKFMQLIRQRNALLKLENTTLKEFNDFPMENEKGTKTSLFELPGKYLCVYYGDFQTFLLVRSALLKTSYFDEIQFVYFNQPDALEKISKNPLYKLNTVLTNTVMARSEEHTS